MSSNATGEVVFDDYESPVDDKERTAFERVTDKYCLISKIGEGTFSTVYKAEDSFQHLHDNSWIEIRGGDRKASYYVAIKRIYVTSSPQRIFNEIDILRSLSGSENVLPLITAFRHEDEVFLVLPYFKHPDFRSYYKELSLRDIRYYMRSLFLALEDVHAVDVIHRDVKPTNFLYDVAGRKGELVDFGLAERQQEQGQCPCQARSGRPIEQMSGMVNPTHIKLRGAYLKEDQRPGKRANRAGTRGFRAPEVLFKCDSQFTAVDIWSAGVILLTFLSSRFPFFNSNDDVDALMELASIYGKAQIKNVAAQHNCSFESNVPTLHEKAISFTRLVHWSTDSQRRSDDQADSHEQEMALHFLEKCMTLDPWQRWSATEALQDEFLRGIEADETCDEQITDLSQEVDMNFEAGGLESAAEIDSPTAGTEEDNTEQGIYKDATSDAKSSSARITGRPKEFVFLKTDDVPDENLHSQMRQQLIDNVNTMRARREASLKRHASVDVTTRPMLKARSQSVASTFQLQTSHGDLATPLHQIPANTSRPSTPKSNLKALRARALTESPAKTNHNEARTIDPRLIENCGTLDQTLF